MSRIGKNPIAIPAGVDVTIDGQNVTVKGPKGTLSHVVAEPIVAKIEDGQVVVERPNDERTSRSLHGLSRTLIANMIVGVTEVLTLGDHAVTGARDFEILLVALGHANNHVGDQRAGKSVERTRRSKTARLSSSVRTTSAPRVRSTDCPAP